MSNSYLLSASTPLAAPSRQKQLTTRKKMVGYFLSLPGEIRNQIYDLLIVSAISTPGRLLEQTPTSDIPSFTGFDITALPRWTGSPVIRLHSVGRLQILFVNRQVYREISTLLYSRAGSLTFGGYTLQHRNEDPSLRWQIMYGMLERRPGLLRAIRDVTIRLPSVREDLFNGFWNSLGFNKQLRENTVSLNLWAGIPDIVDFLRKFESLMKIRVVVAGPTPEPLDFDALWDFQDMAGRQLKVEFEGLHSSYASWQEYVRKRERLNLEVRAQ